MKPVKRSVAVVLRRDDGAFAVVRRPDDPADPEALAEAAARGSVCARVFLAAR